MGTTGQREESNMDLQAPTKNRRMTGQQPVQTWDTLQQGDRVSVWSPDSFLYTASVDDRTHDGGVLWVIENGPGARRLLLRDDPVELYSTEL